MAKRSPKVKQGPSARQIEKILTEASGDALVNGYQALNPIAEFHDTLDSVASRDLAKRLAADQIVHLAEAWRYISNAVFAYFTHSNGNCIHLAYYAELRGALSLFSGSGIAIQNQRNFYLKADGTKVDFSGRTHEITWRLWNGWVRRSDALSLLRDKISLCPGVSLGEAVDEMGMTLAPHGSLGPIGYDLLNLSRDHNARNRHSYEPYWRTTPLNRMDANDVQFVLNIWRLLLPTGGRLVFDIAYLQFIFQRAEADMAAAANADGGDLEDREEWRARILDRISKRTGVPRDTITAQFEGGVYDISIFELAMSEECQVRNVFARAFFLLRIATLAVQGRIEASANGSGKAWFRNWLDHVGLMGRGEVVAELSDRADDYRLAIDDLEPELDGMQDFPHTILGRLVNDHASLLTRPDACLLWELAS